MLTPTISAICMKYIQAASYSRRRPINENPVNGRDPQSELPRTGYDTRKFDDMSDIAESMV